MKRIAVCQRSVVAFVAAALLGAYSASAASGTWTGSADNLWTNSANWSASPFPGSDVNEKATFDSDGNGNTTLDLAGLPNIGSTTFDTANVAAYTLGAGGANGQTLIIGRSGTHYLTATAGNSQLVNAALQLGGDRTAGNYFFRNESPTKTLTFAGNVFGATTAGTAGGKVLTTQGVGDIVFSGNLSAGTAASLVITNGGLGTLTLSGSNIVKTLVITGNSGTVTDIGSGYLSLENAGANTLYSAQGGAINGTGKIRLSTSSNNNYADNYVAPGKTLVINPSIIGNAGFELWSGTGTFVFNGINLFTENIVLGAAGTLSVTLLGNKRSTTSNLGQGTNITFGASGARLLYTGAGESSDRILNFKNNAVVEHAGTGHLNFTTNCTASSGSKTVTLNCSAAGTAEFSGTLRNDLGTLGVIKAGAGTWIFSAANTYTGATAVSQGTLRLTGNGTIAQSLSVSIASNATLRLENSAAANSANRLPDDKPVSMTGATLTFASDASAANFSETAGPLTISGLGNIVSASQAASGRTSALTFASLARVGSATVDFAGTGLGESDRNRIFITAQADGPIGDWATVNGSPASYSATLGVYVSGLVGIAAKGDVIVSNDTSNVSITTEGTTGPISLSHDVTVVRSLAQTTPFEATVNTAGKALLLDRAAISAGATNLTLGAAQSDGTLSAAAAGGELALANIGAGTLTVNAVIADNASPSPLAKSGTGPVVLGGANTFTGPVTVSQGSLVLANSLALQNVLFANPTGIVFDSSVSTHAFTLGNLTNSFNLALADNAGNPLALSVGNNNADSAYGGVLSGAGSFSKIGAGALTLTAANTLSGGVAVEEGTLTVTQTSGLGTGGVTNNGTLNLNAGNVTYSGLSASLAGNGTVNVLLGATTSTTTLNGDYSAFTGTWNLGYTGVGGKAIMNGLDNPAATVNVLTNATLYSSAAVTHQASAVLSGGDTGESVGQLRLESNAVWAGDVTLARDVTGAGDGFFGGNTTTGTVSGVISDANGAHAVAKIGTGVIRFTGTNNTYGGETSIRAGTLAASSLRNVGQPSSLGQPADAAAGTIHLGTGTTAARLSYIGTGDTTDRTIDLSIGAGDAYLEQSGNGLLTFTSPLTYSGTGTKNLYLHGSTAGVGELAGAYANGVAATNKLIKNGSGRWILSAANTYSGETELQNGTLALAHPNALSGSSLVRFTARLQNNATLEFANDGVGETVRDITVGVGYVGTLASGVGTGSAGINHLVGELSLSHSTLTVARASSVLSGTPSITARSVNLSGGNTYTTTLKPVDADLIVGTAAILANNYSKTLRLDGSSAGNAITGAVYNGLNTLTLIKDGASTWTLGGSNTYSGATTVNNGTLVLSGPVGSIASSSGLTLNSGGTLRLSSTAADNHPNRLRDAATVTLNGGTLEFDHPGGAADYSETLGAVTLGVGSSTLSVSQADGGRTSALTLASLARGANAELNFSGAGLGADDRSRIFIGGQPDGLIGFWAFYNGSGLAAYSSALGVYSGSSTTTNIAARGPDSIIPDDAAASARITEPGETGPITLAGATESRVAALQQCTTTAATVDLAGKTFRTQGIAINAGQEALTIGASEGDGTLTPLSSGGKLDLANESSNTLTVNAAIANNDVDSALAKSGTGSVLLNGACSHSGPTTIYEGSLTFASSATQCLAGAIGGAGALVKEGTNVLTLAGRNTYTGITYINAGIVLAQTNQAFGATTAGTVIAPGATLDVGAARAANTLNLGGEPFTVSGSGVGGKGAIVNNSAISQYNSVNKVTLAGDTTFGGTDRFDIRNNTPTLNLGGFTLTKVGANMFGITSATVTPGAGHMDVQQGTLRLESSTVLNGGETNTLTIRSGARFELYQVQNPQFWRLNLDDGSTFDAATQSSAATHNRWAGPVSLNGAVTLTTGNNAGYVGNLLGDITGTGPLTKTGIGTVSLSSTSNTYSGATLINAGTLAVSNLCGVGVACSLGQPATAADGTIRLGSGTTSAGLTYFGAGDTTDRLLDLAGTTGGATLNASGTGPLRFENGFTFSGAGAKLLTLRGTSYAGGEIPFSLTNGSGSALSVTKSDSGRWILSGTNTFTGNFTIQNGTVELTGSNSLGTANVYVADSAGDAILRMPAGSSLHGGVANLCVGNTSGGNGAFYLDGGEIVRSPTTGNDQAFGIGRLSGAYGYFNMSSGSLTVTRIQLGPSSSAGRGIVRVTGGYIRFPEWMLLARYTGSECVFTLDGGIVNHANSSQNIGIGYEGGRGELNIRGGALESYGASKYLTIRQSAGSPTGIVNLCGGKLSLNAIQNNASGTAYLNFSGGMLQAGANSTVFVPTNMTGVYVNGPFNGYAGGAVIDTAGYAVTIPAPLRAPTGDGVFGITLANPGSGYIGEPYVAITGGGVGATAIANMEDDGTGKGTYRVASISVTAPGVDYATPPTVLLKGGGSLIVTALVDTVTLAPNTSGGLTKSGAGVLTLAGTNTYAGTTTISNGTLKIGIPAALPTGTPVVLAGGTLDLGGLTLTNLIGGAGALTNGIVETVLSPAGEGALGADALALRAGASLSGTYVADVTASGASDLLAIEGGVDLSGLALQIVDPGALDTHRIYTLLTCTGARTGTFSANNLPSSRWHLLYLSNGTVQLIYASGTLIRVR